MDKADQELSKQVKIVNELGLHARTSAQIVRIARNSTSRIWVSKDGEKVDAASVIDILTLACGKGTTITIEIEDSSDIGILNDIVTLVERGFGE